MLAKLSMIEVLLIRVSLSDEENSLAPAFSFYRTTLIPTDPQPPQKAFSAMFTLIKNTQQLSETPTELFYIKNKWK